MCFMIFLNEKMHSGAIKLRSLERRKIEFFLFGSVHGLGRKLAFFHARKDCFVIILDRKEGLVEKKTNLVKEVKKSTFSKGVSAWFLLKKKMTSFDVWFF